MGAHGFFGYSSEEHEAGAMSEDDRQMRRPKNLRRFDVTLHVTGSEAFGRVEVVTKRVMDPDGMYAIYEDVESRLAAADRLAEAANQFLDAHREHCIGSLGDVEDGFDDALADYENTKKGEP